MLKCPKDPFVRSPLIYLLNVLFVEKVVIKDSSQGLANFTGGGYEGAYVAAQLHFHWGANNSLGSDHTVNGSHYPLSVSH